MRFPRDAVTAIGDWIACVATDVAPHAATDISASGASVPIHTREARTLLLIIQALYHRGTNPSEESPAFDRYLFRESVPAMRWFSWEMGLTGAYAICCSKVPSVSSPRVSRPCSAAQKAMADASARKGYPGT